MCECKHLTAPCLAPKPAIFTCKLTVSASQQKSPHFGVTVPRHRALTCKPREAGLKTHRRRGTGCRAQAEWDGLEGQVGCRAQADGNVFGGHRLPARSRHNAAGLNGLSGLSGPLCVLGSKVLARQLECHQRVQAPKGAVGQHGRAGLRKCSHGCNFKSAENQDAQRSAQRRVQKAGLLDGILVLCPLPARWRHGSSAPQLRLQGTARGRAGPGHLQGSALA